MNPNRLLNMRDRILQNPVVHRVMACLPDSAPPQVYLVGGALRDHSLGRPVLDFDFALPGDACALARTLSQRLQARYILLDEQWGVSRLLWYPQGRHAAPVTLDFASLQGASILEDLEQRDFTCNAIALRLAGSEPDPGSAWLDPTGGLKDLEARRIRMVHPRVFRQDPVRILRAFRLACSLGFEIDGATCKVMREERNAVLEPAAERVGDELFKLFSSKGTLGFLKEMDHCGLLTTLFPELQGLKGMTQGQHHRLDAWDHTLETYRSMEQCMEKGLPCGLTHWEKALNEWFLLRKHAEILLKTAALFHDIGKPITRSVGADGGVHFYGHAQKGADLAEGILQRIRASRNDQERVRTWVRYHMGPLHLLNAMEKGQLSQRAKIRFLRRLGTDTVGVLLLSIADMQATAGNELPGCRGNAYRELVDSLFRLYFERDAASLQTRPLLTGNDLMEALQLTPGPLIGRLLERVEEARIQGQIRDRTEALDLAGSFWRKLRTGKKE